MLEPDVPLTVAWALAWGTLLLVVLMVLALLLLRWRRWRQQPRWAAFEARWRPLLMGCALGDAPQAPLPPLAARERWPWMRLWLQLHMSLQGPSRQRLAALGRSLGVGELALARARSPHPSERWMGLHALGFLQDAAHTPLLLQALSAGGPPERVYAARALLEIDEARHAATVAQALLACPDLEMSLVSVMLKPFRRALQAGLPSPSAQAQTAASLAWLRLARALGLQLPQPMLAPFLAPEQDPEVLMAALRLVQGEQGTAVVAALAQHAHWPVRAQVARALADIGTRAELPLLVRLTADAQWWVRYRAAQALLRLPGMDPAQALQQVQAHGDRYALDMLQAVLAESGRPA